jgi:hypothetical protein
MAVQSAEYYGVGDGRVVYCYFDIRDSMFVVKASGELSALATDLFPLRGLAMMISGGLAR